MEVGTQIVYEIQVLNQKIIKNYLEARSIEANLAVTTQKVTNGNLNRFSRFVNKNFKDVTRADTISFLNKLRKNESDDPNHKWIGTYNLFTITLGSI